VDKFLRQTRQKKCVKCDLDVWVKSLCEQVNRVKNERDIGFLFEVNSVRVEALAEVGAPARCATAHWMPVLFQKGVRRTQVGKVLVETYFAAIVL
jgi:hypothetical protein